MKFFFLFSFIIVTMGVHAQEFMGVKVEGDKLNLISQFKSKGFVLKGDSKQDAVIMEGNIGSKTYEIVISVTPKTKQVWKLSVYLPKSENWSRIREEYNEYLDLLTTKYGKPEQTYAFFASPYKEGDGYEMSAIGLEKCYYSAYWEDNIGISIQISKFKQVKVSYENKKNVELLEVEKKEVNSKIF